ncbi:hypothetical protein J6590_075700 [Homalodisca vitripennis]|nr:hypothetical protein J6590_075700 [Homalodisca vitripennis]
MRLFAALFFTMCSQLIVLEAAGSGCVSDGKSFKVGEQYDIPGSCSLNVCKGNDEWTRAACGFVGLPEGWTFVPEDSTKPYPQCCGHAAPPQ